MIDSIKLTNYENSLFMIKPDGYPYKREIINELLKNFQLVELNDVVLTEHFLEELYQGEKEEFKDMNVEYMKNRKAIIGIVGGLDCKKKLFEVCGTHFKGEECNPDSIRHKFNVCPNPILINGREFYVNCIHRSSPEEADEEIMLYKKEYVYLKQKEEVKEEQK